MSSTTRIKRRKKLLLVAVTCILVENIMEEEQVVLDAPVVRKAFNAGILPCPSSGTHARSMFRMDMIALQQPIAMYDKI